MRILAIRGMNLASLAEPFAIEFEREPLRSAGLFAITGETGAGKSTILDALCLALYDKFPRVVAAGGAEGAPDPSGDTLASGDPRAILRRGAGRGFAEADFVARDGKRYRARCDLMRARGKVAGRLQNRGRSLWRIDESGEKVEAIESGVELVNRRIVELTDLTFDEFRRTALLAQGDFDAFLRADAKERADLLEKITGAEIYGALSRRAYEQWDQARKTLSALEERHDDIGVMTEEERAAITAEYAEIAEKRTALGAEREETQAMLRRLEAMAQAREKLVRAEADRAAAADAFAALARECQTLVDLERVEPLRAPRQEARKAEAALAEKQATASSGREQAETARAALEEASMRERAAAEAVDAAKGAIAQFEPLWAKASALDSRIDIQTQEVARARAVQEAASQRANEKRDALDAMQAEAQAAEVARDSARLALEALAPARALSERWREIDEWLSKRMAFSKERSDTSRALQKAVDELKRTDEWRTAFDAADRTDREALEALGRQMRERESALLALDAPGTQRRLDATAREYELLHDMGRCARDYDAAQARVATAGQDISRSREEGAALARELKELRMMRDAQAKQKEEAERLGELADAAADPHALALRTSLEAGEPCPVCGGTDHPFAQSNDAVRTLVETLRARRDSLRRELADVDAKIAAASAREAAARALHEEAARREKEARSALETAAQDYARRFARRPPPDAPKEIAGAAQVIAALIEDAVARRETATTILATAQQLRADIDLLRQEADGKRNAVEARNAERGETEALARRAGEDRARLTQALADARERIESIDRSLSSFLPLCDLTTDDLDRDAPGARKRLEDAGARFRAARESLESAEARLAKLIPEAAALAAEERAVAAQAKVAAAAFAERAAELAKSREARAELLGGEPTAAHRACFEEKLNVAQAAHATLRDALAETDKMKAACDERSAGAARDVEAAQAALAAARRAFAATLAATGFDEEAATPLLDISREESTALRRAVEAAQSALHGAETAVAQRRSDLADAEAARLPETPREQLAAREADLAQALDVFATRLGALDEKLAQDDAARGRAEALAAEIEDARAKRKIWDEINAAIGSKEGDKFRRFAQSVTLEQLVALANRRLALLSPRYRLERGGEIGALGLQIVDRDLGDERRSTRSLSGGERFLASLALALALAGLEGRESFVDTLFIDEGFGALDSATLDVAIDALENLQGQGRKVGVISHVESLQSRIATRICVERRGGGVSVVRLRAPGIAA